MGKQDENRLRNATNTERDRALGQSNAGISASQTQANTAQTNAGDTRSAVLSGISNFNNKTGLSGTTPTGSDGSFADRVNALYSKYGKSDTGKGSGITDASYWTNEALRNANGDESYVLGRLEADLQGKGMDVGGGGVPAPDYLQAFRDMQGSTGGFDPTRLGNIGSVTDKLRNTSGNYGDTNTSIRGLQDFAKTGGINQEQLSRIYDPTLQEFSRTGGYSDVDKANMRARSNAGIADTYQNMKDTLARQRAASGNFSPGVGATGFKLARQSAQDVANQAQTTEANILDAVNKNRLAAGGTLSNAALGVSGLQSSNTLGGYTNAANLDLSKQKQVQDALAASGGLDLNTQQLINQTRLAATSGLSQDALGRGSLAIQQGGLDLGRERLAQEGQEFGVDALMKMYGMDVGQFDTANNLLLNYRNSAANQQNALLGGPMTTLSNSPGFLDRAVQGINAATGLASPIMSGIGRFRGGTSGIPGYGGMYEGGGGG